ncbi:phage tail protein I [Maritalea porphyrae]|uniref:phage tail protein I n=1 Tax=Maritalea porphyrae TaxID=880732 RepID=UPI0022AE6774|nr:phage tail protein I [Maritalea porphyrae]MCZ4270716.1 phage tail protein I [Maritalea porphyrae]
MTADFQTILPPNSTQWERAVERVSGERWDTIDPDVIRRFKNAWDCPPELLNFLAHELSVDIWDEGWDEYKKRSVCAQSLENHRLKGTKEGHRRYLNIVDADLVDTKTGPQGFALSGPVDKKSWDAYIKRMPSVRISLENRQGEWQPPNGFFIGSSALDDDHFSVETGLELLGRRAYYKPTDAVDEVEVSVDHIGGNSLGDGYEQVSLHDANAGGFYIGESPLDDTSLAAELSAQSIFSFRLNSGLNSEIDNLPLDSLGASLEPMSPRFERVSAYDFGLGQFFLDADFLDDGALRENNGAALISDVVYLHDPDIAVPVVDALAVLGVSRLGFPTHTAEMLVRAEDKLLPSDGFVLGQTFIGEDAMNGSKLKKVDSALDAIVASKRFTDRLLVDFQTTTSPSLSTGLHLDQTTPLDARVPAIL